MDEGIAVIIAACLAILGIMYASRQQRKMLRKQHTYQVIEKLNDWKDFDERMDFASGLIRAGKVPTLCDEAHKENCDKIDFLLNYYEFLSSAIIAGDVDEGLVRRVEETRLSRLYLKFIEYVRENRDERDSRLLWENLEFMCYRWKLERDDAFGAIVTWFALRPSTARFHQQRDEIDAALKDYSRKIK